MSTFSRLRKLVRIKQGIAEKTTPRWILFLADIGIIGFSVYLAFLLRFNFRIPKENYDLMLFADIIFILVRLTFFSFFKVYSHIIRYTGITDLRRLFITITLGTVTLFCLSILGRLTNAFPILPFSVIAIEFFISLYLISNLRILAKSFYLLLFNYELNSKKVLIFGSRDLAVIAKEALELNPSRKFKVQAFFDSQPRRKKNKLMGLAIHHISDLQNLITKYKITHVVFADRNTSDDEKEYIAEICIQQD
ncbi:MAG: hypothetical protein JXA03_07875, partial [Bacteroidales bacterium]|nr:hypothetical protein [Bacteroidales bacterium]